jgi:hypothetical protein
MLRGFSNTLDPPACGAPVGTACDSATTEVGPPHAHHRPVHPAAASGDSGASPRCGR